MAMPQPEVSDIHREQVRLLASIFKKIGNFDMTSFSKRLNVQKTEYFLQVFKVFVAHKFNYYIRGPYSPDLAKDTFLISDKGIMNEVKPIEFVLNDNFVKFLNFIKGHEMDSEWLELHASLHFLIAAGKTKEGAIKMIQIYKGRFNAEQCESAYQYLKKYGLVD